MSRNTVRLRVTTGRENPGSRKRHPTDEEYREWEWTKDTHFHQSADRLLRGIATYLRSQGFKVRRHFTRSHVGGLDE